MKQLRSSPAILIAAVWAGTAVAAPTPVCTHYPVPTGAGVALCPPSGCPRDTATAFAAIDAQRKVENPAFATIESQLPPTYVTLSNDQKILVLMNAERALRGIFAQNAPTPGQNDVVVANVAANHALLVAKHAEFWNYGLPHENAYDGTPSSRISAVPAFTGKYQAGEIIAVDSSPEAAVYEWMYDDASSSWGHRASILSCLYPYAGAGAAAAPSNSAVYGASSAVYVVDFITPLTLDWSTDTYNPTPPTPPVAACPVTPAPATYTCPAVTPPAVDSSYGYLAVLSADGTTVNISATISVDPITVPVASVVQPTTTTITPPTTTTQPNAVVGLWVYQPAVIGSPSGGVAELGLAPQGTGGTACALAPVLHSALDPTDPAAKDPLAVSSRCVLTLPFAGNPVEIIIADQYNNLIDLPMTLAPPLVPTTP